MNEWVLRPDRFLSKEEIGKLLKRAEELRSLGVAKSRKQCEDSGAGGRWVWRCSDTEGAGG